MGGITFEEVFEDLFVEAYRVSIRILRNHNDAEDVAAETMARALDKWRRVRVSSPRGWVVRVAGNLAVDIVRRRQRAADRPAVPVPDNLDDNDSHLAIVDLLRRLPRRQCDVIALRYLVGFSEAEIAAKLGISPGTVKRHASRAIDRLRRDEIERVPSVVL